MRDFVTKEDVLHGRRVITAACVASLPVWGVLLITGLGMRSVFWSVAAMAVMLPPVVLYVSRIAHTGICQTCGKKIRFSPMQGRFTAGDDYTFRCNDCRTVWRTNMRPGSDLS